MELLEARLDVRQHAVVVENALLRPQVVHVVLQLIVLNRQLSASKIGRWFQQVRAAVVRMHLCCESSKMQHMELLKR